MKYKNYKSAIHNFAHSFQSIDFMKSPKLALNVLIRLQNKGFLALATFDFIHRVIQPVEASSKESIQLLDDYIGWLPIHLANHNCDLLKLEKLHLTIWADFSKAITPNRMKDYKEVNIYTKAIWKADGREENIIEISQTEHISDKFLKTQIPEL